MADRQSATFGMIKKFANSHFMDSKKDPEMITKIRISEVIQLMFTWIKAQTSV